MTRDSPSPFNLLRGWKESLLFFMVMLMKRLLKRNDLLQMTRVCDRGKTSSTAASDPPHKVVSFG